MTAPTPNAWRSPTLVDAAVFDAALRMQVAALTASVGQLAEQNRRQRVIERAQRLLEARDAA